MKKKILVLTLSCMLALSVVACGSEKKNETTKEVNISSESDKKADEESTNEAVASGDETVEAVDVVSPDMEAIYASSIKDGEYDIKVDSSSSMFNITACKLSVVNGEMQATMTMGGTGYLYVYMGVSEDAVNADESTYIPFVENENGEHTFTVPVDALDAGIDCAAFSKKKELWYDRVIVFRADSLPSEAFVDGFVTSAKDLGLEDGTYSVDVVLEGGSGKASVESPAVIKVTDGEVIATITWSSKNYDYMKVDDVRYDRINEEGNSVFEIPVKGFDYKMAVIGDTVAMSEPHEIDYTLYFDSKSIQKQ